jgi:uncharacterized protein (TIGR02145 family)
MSKMRHQLKILKFTLLFAGLAVAILIFSTCKKPERVVSFFTLNTIDTNIKYTSARLEWEIKDLGSKPIKSHGIAISEDFSLINVTPKSSTENADKGIFSVLFTDLKKNTTYYYVAFVSIGNVPEYGSDIKSFKTKDTQVASLSSVILNDTTLTTARVTATVTSDGGESVIKRGFCWGKNTNPQIGTGIDTTVNGIGTGSLTGLMHGLDPGTQYFIKAYAVNAKGTAYSQTETTFTTYNIPVVTTLVLSSQTNIGATSGGTITNSGGATITGRGVCWNTSTAPTITLSTKTSDGTGVGTYASSITGLTPGTLYYIRAYATNRFGTGYASNEIQYTPAKPATANTAAASLIGNTMVTLNGTVNANNFSATVTFEYGTTTSYGSTIPATPSTVTGSSTTNVSANISGLTQGTFYHFKVKAVNAGGTTDGGEQTFTTLQEPSATTDAATNITTTSATLNGTVNANNSSTNVSFEYGTSTAYGSTVSASPGTVTGNTNTLVNASLTGLTQGTTYHYRVKAVSSGGTIYGLDKTIDTQTPPSVTTIAATSVANTTSTINGTINANNFSTTVTFEYGLTTSYGSTVPGSPSPVTGSTLTSVLASLTGLTPGAVYHFRVAATSSAGTTYGSDLTFTTLLEPIATTTPATLIGNMTVTLNGTVNANNSSSIVTFEYGLSTAYGTMVAALESPVTGNSSTSVTANLTGLTPGTTYHFKVKAVSAGGTADGADLSFTTTQPPTVTTGSAGSITTTTGTLNGTVNANNLSSTVTFDYGTTTSYGLNISAIPSPVTGSTVTSVSASLSGLTPSTTYHFRVKAMSSGGISYGNDGTFLTSSATITDFDENVYNTIPIGTQVWVQENLKVTHYRNGDLLSSTNDEAVWSNMTDGAYCWYNNDAASNKLVYGGLYNYYATVDNRQLCPTGWHVPTLAEWTVLINYLGGLSVAGGKIKEAGIAHWASPNTGADNSSGLTALPGGVREGGYANLGVNGRFWSSSESTSGSAYGYNLHFTISSIQGFDPNKNNGLSVRCLKGEGLVLAAVTTSTLSSIGSTTSTSGGNITSDGGATVTARGVCWNTSTGPTTANSKTTDGSGTGAFTSNITGLSPGTAYYIRAYATNSVGTVYGNELNFTTPIPPTTTTGSALAVTANSATISGTVNANNLSSAVTFEYGTTTSYGLSANALESPVTGSSATSVSTSLSGLTPSTIYHFRVKAVSTGGTSYGNDGSFTTSAALLTVSDYDANIYNVITIGTQDWMQSNLKTTHYNNGEIIPEVTDGPSWGSLTSGAYTWYSNDATTYKDTYGGLYNWYTTVDIRNVCPTGWHVPTNLEWTTLTSYVGENPGGQLKETGLTHWITVNVCATNTFNFTGLPGGYREWSTCYFDGLRTVGYFWSSNSYSIRLGNGYCDALLDGIIPQSYGFSVRCLKGSLPLTETNTAGAVSSTSVSLYGKVNPNTSPTIVTFEYGTTTSYGSTVTAVQSPVSGAVPVNVSADLTGLTTGTTYHYRVKAVNSGGTNYGRDMSFIAISIGDSYQGGIVAYILQVGDPGYIAGETHGLIAAPSDQSTGSTYGCFGTSIPEASGAIIGTGNQNTIAIVAACTTAGIAARLCSDLVLNGYNDWYLPSKDELHKLYLNKSAIGGFTDNYYWSSSEYGLGWDWWENFLNGYIDSTYSYEIGYVRAIRAF